jgi:pimeloyl-ACP methyl ester carboxylesterase
LAPAATVLPFSKELLKRMMLTLIPLRCFSESTIYWVWEDLVKKDEAGRIIADTRVDHLRLAYSCFKFKVPVNPTVLEDEELQSLNVPALYLVGEHEKIYPAEQAVSRLNQVAPRITTGIIPNAGHDLAIVQADLVNNKVIEFLRN